MELFDTAHGVNHRKVRNEGLIIKQKCTCDSFVKCHRIKIILFLINGYIDKV